MNKFKPQSKGFGLLEIVVGSAIISVSLFVLLGVTRNALILSRETSRSVRASFIMEEGLEAVRILRDTSWSQNINTLSTDTDYYLYFDGQTWVSTTTEQVIDGIFTRKFVLSDVYRDASSDIKEFGTLDPKTLMVDVDVSWTSANGNLRNENANMYLTDYFNE